MGLPRFNEDSYAHFLTTKTYKGRRVFDDPTCCRIVVETLHFYAKHYHYDLVAYCVMPDHVHSIIQWDSEVQPKLTISKVMQSIKSHTAKEISSYFTLGRRKPSLSPYSAASEGSRLPVGYRWTDRGQVHTQSTRRIWQPSFYDFNIFSEKMLRQKVDYVHWNPVRAGLCKQPEDWPWSSAKSAVY